MAVNIAFFNSMYLFLEYLFFFFSFFYLAYFSLVVSFYIIYDFSCNGLVRFFTLVSYFLLNLMYVFELRSDIHCEHFKSILHITYTINFQYWQWISEYNFMCININKILDYYGIIMWVVKQGVSNPWG